MRGGAPGTRETDLLDPVNHVQQVNAIVLSGGSAFGLDAATGVVRYLDERGIGYDVARREGADRAGGDPVRPRLRRQARRSARPPTAATRRRWPPPTGRWPRATSARARARPSARWRRARAADEGRDRLGVDHAAGRPRRGRARRRQRRRRHHRSGRRARSSPACAPRTARDSPTRARCSGRARSARVPTRRARRRSRAASGREHDHRRRRHQRDPHQGRGAEGGADGARRFRARDLARPHAGRRRHDLRGGHRHPRRARRTSASSAPWPRK